MTEEQAAAGPGNVGFIGIGTMGAPMATNLLKAGHRLFVHDVREEAPADLVSAGATRVATPAEAARNAPVVFISLPGPDEVEAVVTGPDGVLAGAAEGSVIVDLSTNSPRVVRSLADRAAANGVSFLDAPVSGGAAGAIRGSLTVMVGGDAAAFASVRPLLECIGGQIFHVGEVGAGNTVKLVNNLLAITNMLTTVEALVLAGKAGVDLERLRDVINTGSGRSNMWEYGSRLVLTDRLKPSFTVGLAAKDIGLAVQLASELEAPLPVGGHIEALLRGHRDGGFAHEDVFTTVKALEEQAGIIIRGTGAQG